MNMNELTVSGLAHVLEGIALIVVGISTHILAPMFHMAMPNPGVGGFQLFCIGYGIAKIIAGVYLMNEWK